LTKVFEFNKEEENQCPFCEQVDGYLHEALQAENEEELRQLLHGLAQDSFKDGYDAALIQDIDVKMKILDGDLED